MKRVVVRVVKPVASGPEWGWVVGLANSYTPLVLIDFRPPASGPEIELVFDASDEELIVKLCKECGLHVLASKVKEV